MAGRDTAQSADRGTNKSSQTILIFIDIMQRDMNMIMGLC